MVVLKIYTMFSRIIYNNVFLTHNNKSDTDNGFVNEEQANYNNESKILSIT